MRRPGFTIPMLHKGGCRSMSDPKDKFKNRRGRHRKKNPGNGTEGSEETTDRQEAPKSKIRNEIRKEQGGRKKGRGEVPQGKKKGPRPYMRR